MQSMYVIPLTKLVMLRADIQSQDSSKVPCVQQSSVTLEMWGPCSQLHYVCWLWASGSTGGPSSANRQEDK